MSVPFTMGPALLFCPGDRPDRIVKAAARADAVVVDLEDAVAPGRKAEARAALASVDLDPERTIVRIATDPSSREQDLEAVAAASLHWVLVGKCESVDDLDGLEFFDVVAQIETAAAVPDLAAIAAHPTVSALFWGAEDLIASTGGTTSRGPDGTYRDVVRLLRASVLLAAAAAGKPAIDAVVADFRDEALQRREALDAAASGFAATACIHPAQVEVIREAYTPSDEDLRRATSLLEGALGGGVSSFDGTMVDAPVYQQARRILARARR